MIKKLIKNYLLNKAIKNGLQIGQNSSILGIPKVGSEPYLISIGDNVTVTANVTFITHDGATRVFRQVDKYKYVIKYGRITIKDNSFIGTNTTILPGVSIGPNAIVAAGSVVIQDVPPNTIVGGNPSKFITTVQEYANKSLNETPDYSIDDYLSNKKEELLRLFPYPW